jgi:predicted Zn-dependent protease
LLYATEVASSTDERSGRLPTPAEAIDSVVGCAQGADLVGILSSGPVWRGFANSLGQRNWHAVDAALLDWSIYLQGDRAVKSAYATREWSPPEVAERIAQARERLALLQRPAHPLAPGVHRAYLAPAAVDDLAGMLNWGAVSLREQRTRQSPLQKLADGEAALSPLVTVREDTGGGLAPAFDEVGFRRPAQVALIESGRHAGAMTSARSAQEYGMAANGADEDESAQSLSMAGGSLPESEVLAALDTGLYVSNLHYLNWSDRRDARITGLTRFACFRVEGGRIVAPVPVMRFDDTLYRLFGAALEGLTQTPEWLPDTRTYEQRSVRSARVPGALLSGLTLTL